MHAYIRTNDFPRIAVNRNNGNLYATWQDYRNGEFDIQLATSRNAGFTWSDSGTVNPDSGLDHYFPADAVAGNSQGDEDSRGGDRVGDSYFRTERSKIRPRPVVSRRGSREYSRATQITFSRVEPA